MLMAYASVAAFFGVAGGFVLVALLAGKLIRPDRGYSQKLETYECGEAPVGPAWFNFNPRFYIVALVFLIFDVEVAFTYPVAPVFRRWVRAGAGALAFVELLVFLSIVVVGLAYVWAKGDLEWLKTLKPISVRTPVSASPSAPLEQNTRAPAEEG